MFWIAWCYFGLTILQISDSQRRAIVNYSYPTAKPTPTTSSPTRSTTIATEETSINSISKSLTTESLAARGSSRGESQVKINKRKEAAVVIPSSLAKGDFAGRDRAPHSNDNTTTLLPPKDAVASIVPAPRDPSRPKEETSGPKEKASILTASSAEGSEEDRVYARRVFPPGTENRPEDKNESGDRNARRNPPTAEPNSRPDIAPTKAYQTDSGSARVEEPPDRPPRDDVRPPPRDYIDRETSELPRRDDIQSSRRTEPESVYRDPDFDREYPRRYAASSGRGRTRYDEFDDDERGSRGRYEKRDRGRDSDDRYSKGDTRVYPDDRSLPVDPLPPSEDRYRSRERYPDDIPRRGDDDRYDDRPRSRDRDTRYRDPDDKSPLRDDRYRSRGDDDRYRSRDDERYRTRDDDRYRSRDDVRPRDEERYVYRDGDRYRSRDDERYRVGEEDRYRARDDERYRSNLDDRRDLPLRPRDDERDGPRVDDAKYVDSTTTRIRDPDFRESVSRGGSSLAADRRPISSRAETVSRVGETVIDYDTPIRDRSRSYARDDVIPSRISRPTYDDDDDERYRDRNRDEGYRRPSRYDDDVRDISPTRTRDDAFYSRSSLVDSRPRDVSGSRYIDSDRDRVRDDRYYEQDDRVRNTRIQDSRRADSASENSRRVPEDPDRYRTRLSSERTDPKISDRRDEVVLDRRSYASEEDDKYKRRGSVVDEDRRLLDETRRPYRDDEAYTRRDPIDDEDYKRSRARDEYDRDRVRSRDKYDDDYRRYDDKYPAKGDVPPPVRKYDTYPDEEERSRRRDSEISATRKEDREEKLRPSSSVRDEERLYSKDEYPDTKSRRRYDDDIALPERDARDDYADDRRYGRGSRPPITAKEYTIGSSRTSSVNAREPTDIVSREKRFQNSSNRQQSSMVVEDAASYSDVEPKSREQLRPLSAKDVIEAAIRHSDGSNQNSRKVYYPVFDPRVSNLTSPEIIRPNERRGTTITAKKRRSV